MNVGIVGLGLIGGSMARSIKERTGHRVYGVDLDGETMSMARLMAASLSSRPVSAGSRSLAVYISIS